VTNSQKKAAAASAAAAKAAAEAKIVINGPAASSTGPEQVKDVLQRLAKTAQPCEQPLPHCSPLNLACLVATVLSECGGIALRAIADPLAGFTFMDQLCGPPYATASKPCKESTQNMPCTYCKGNNPRKMHSHHVGKAQKQTQQMPCSIMQVPCISCRDITHKRCLALPLIHPTAQSNGLKETAQTA